MGTVTSGAGLVDWSRRRGTPAAFPAGAALIRRKPITFVLWMLSVVLLVAGIYFLLQRKWLIAIVVILVGAIIGPIGVSLIDHP